MNIFHIITEDLSLDRASVDLEIFFYFLYSKHGHWEKVAQHNVPLGYEYLEKWAARDFAGQIVWCLTSVSVSVVIAGNQ